MFYVVIGIVITSNSRSSCTCIYYYYIHLHVTQYMYLLFLHSFTCYTDNDSHSSLSEVEGVVFRDAIKQMLITTPPSVLCLHLKRYYLIIITIHVE